MKKLSIPHTSYEKNGQLVVDCPKTGELYLFNEEQGLCVGCAAVLFSAVKADDGSWLWYDYVQVDELLLAAT